MPKSPCAALLERVGGDEQIFAELCDMFLADAPKRLEAIRDAVAAVDATAVRGAAHAFRGAAAAFDANAVVAAAVHLEAIALAGDLATAAGGEAWASLDALGRALIADVRAGRVAACRS